MQFNKNNLKKLIIEAINFPSIISNGGQLLELEEYMGMLKNAGMPANPKIYLDKINGVEEGKLPEADIKKLKYQDGQKIFGKDLNEILKLWIEENNTNIKREIAKVNKLIPQTTASKTPEKKGLLGLGFLGLEEQKVTKLNEQILKKLIVEELENMELEEIELEESQLDEGFKKWLTGIVAAAALAAPAKAKADEYHVEIKNPITGEVVISRNTILDPSTVEDFIRNLQNNLVNAGKNYNVSVKKAGGAAQEAQPQVATTKSGAKQVVVKADSQLSAMEKASKILGIKAAGLRAVGDPTGKNWTVTEIK